MDINEYMKNVAPTNHESVLNPHRQDLLRLKKLGYTLSQMHSFLAANSVVVGRRWISAYLTRSEKRPRAGGVPRHQTPAPQPQDDASSPEPENLIPAAAGVRFTGSWKPTTTKYRDNKKHHDAARVGTKQ